MRVAEDQRAGHERHTEDDGEGGEQQAELAREQALEGDSEQRQLPRCAGTSKLFMRSRTDSAVGVVHLVDDRARRRGTAPGRRRRLPPGRG